MNATPFPEVETPNPATSDAPPSAEPQDIADEFLAAAQESADESGLKVTGPKKRGRRAAVTTLPDEPPPQDLPKWTPDGIGLAAAFAVNFGFMRADMPTLEPEEEKKVKTVTALYLNYRAPKAAAIQPEVMILALLAELLGPRLAAKAAVKSVTQSHGLERTA